MRAFRKQLPQLASFNLISSPIGPNLRRRKNPHNRIKIQFRRQLPKPPPGFPAQPFDPHLGPRIIIAALNHISRTPLWSLICIATCNLHVQKKDPALDNRLSVARLVAKILFDFFILRFRSIFAPLNFTSRLYRKQLPGNSVHVHQHARTPWPIIAN